MATVASYCQENHMETIEITYINVMASNSAGDTHSKIMIGDDTFYTNILGELTQGYRR